MATCIWVDIIQKNSIYDVCHMESCFFKCFLACLQEIEKLARVTVSYWDLLDDSTDTAYSAHLTAHSQYGFDLLCH